MAATLLDAPSLPAPAVPTPAAETRCEECLGSGGWYRYEPALDPAPGRLYLSCVQCRGSGRTVGQPCP
jgi:hypothetical protein